MTPDGETSTRQLAKPSPLKTSHYIHGHYKGTTKAASNVVLLPQRDLQAIMCPVVVN
jgi:hypothetical protein